MLAKTLYEESYVNQIKDISYEDIYIGQKDTITKTITAYDINMFATITGDKNPVHLNETFAAKSIFKKRIAHGMLTGSLISSVLGTKLPGANTIYLNQSLKFLAPCYIGDTLTAVVEVIEKKDAKQILILNTVVTNQSNVKVVEGQAVIKKI